MNQGPLAGDEPCLPVGDVALNVSSSKIDDVAVNASKVCFSVHLLLAYFLLLLLLILFTFSEFLFLQMTDVDREAVVSGGDDARGVPLSSGRNVGTKIAAEDAGAASILDAKNGFLDADFATFAACFLLFLPFVHENMGGLITLSCCCW